MTGSALQEYLLEVIDADEPRRGILPTSIRGGLSLLSNLYDVGLNGYLGLETAGLRRRERLPVPVLSIGNLTVGGTGKTPMAQYICRELVSRGHRLALLSRGHGGKKLPVQVVSDGEGIVLVGPDDAGDEPVLLAQSLPSVPVFVGKDRRITGREALRRHGLDAIVLDDGLQYWQLIRDLDVVLLDSSCPFDNGRTLPRGLLREPVEHLNRAGIAVFTRSESLKDSDRERLQEIVRQHAPEAAVFFARHSPTHLIRLGFEDKTQVPVDALRGVPVLALSGIAQPEAFRRSLQDEAGCRVVHAVDWVDHHKIVPDDVAHAAALAQSSGAEAIVMTEKDAVKWEACVRTLKTSPTIPVYALSISMQIDRPEKFMDTLTTRLFGEAKS